MKHLLLIAVLGLPLAACKPTADSPAGDAPSAPVAAAGTFADFEGVGAPIADTTAAVGADSVVANAAAFAGKTVTVSGTVTEVCQKMGCWATLVTDGGTIRIDVAKTDGTGPYLFTMPKDIAGRHVVATGFLEQTTTPAADVQHMAEESGTHDSTKTYTDLKGLKLTATGVLVRKA